MLQLLKIENFYFMEISDYQTNFSNLAFSDVYSRISSTNIFKSLILHRKKITHQKKYVKKMYRAYIVHKTPRELYQD